MHLNSGIGLEEAPLIQFIVDHMTPQYLDAFRYRPFIAMKDLKQALILFYHRQRDEKIKKREIKRNSAAIAYLEADEETAKMETGEERGKLPTADALMTKNICIH
jgi:hypothetical protein